jgi:hypothetical protein
MARTEDTRRAERDDDKDDARGARHQDKPDEKDKDPHAELKVWVRKEIALAASGVSHDERVKDNP